MSPFIFTSLSYFRFDIFKLTDFLPLLYQLQFFLFSNSTYLPTYLYTNLVLNKNLKLIIIEIS